MLPMLCLTHKISDTLAAFGGQSNGRTLFVVFLIFVSFVVKTPCVSVAPCLRVNP